jgi:uncharacterized membrane protein YqjE
MTIEIPAGRSLTALVSELLRESRDLLRTEIRLIRAEISDKASKLQTAGIALLAGVVFALLALIILSQALIVLLAEFMDPIWATLLVGVVYLVLAAILFAKARNNLKPDNLAPDRSAEQLNKDRRMVREHLS